MNHGYLGRIQSSDLGMFKVVGRDNLSRMNRQVKSQISYRNLYNFQSLLQLCVHGYFRSRLDGC